MKTEDYWDKRSKRYGRECEGVLFKSLPISMNDYLDRWMWGLIERHVDFGGKTRVLDLGCGYGRLSKKIIDKYPKSRVDGVDISRNYIDLYNRDLAPRGKGVVGDIRKLPYKKETFDCVLLITTLLYLTKVPEQEKAIEEMMRVLKPGGKFVVVERNSLGHLIVTLGGLVEKLRSNGANGVETVSFTRAGISDLVEKYGGKFEHVEGVPVWTMSMPLLLMTAKIKGSLIQLILKIVFLLDRLSRHFVAPSLYIGIVGEKLDE